MDLIKKSFPTFLKLFLILFKIVTNRSESFEWLNEYVYYISLKLNSNNLLNSKYYFLQNIMNIACLSMLGETFQQPLMNDGYKDCHVKI